MKPTRVPELGPYAQWVAGAVDRLEEVAPATWEWCVDQEPHTQRIDGKPLSVEELMEEDPDVAFLVMEAGGYTTRADEKLRDLGYREYDGPYVRTTQPWNETDRYVEGDRPGHYRRLEFEGAENDAPVLYDYRTPLEGEGAA